MHVRIVSDGTAAGTEVVDEGGVALRGIERLALTVVPQDVVRVDLHLSLLKVDARAEARVFGTHPSTGEIKQVSSITFADGSEYKF